VVLGAGRDLQSHALTAVQVERQGIRAFHVSIAGEYGKLARRVVEVDAQNRRSAGRDYALAKSNSKMAGLGIALQLKVAQAALKHDLGISGPSLSAQNSNCQRAVGRNAGQAAVFKLNLRPAAFRGRYPDSFKQRRIRQSLIREHLAALGDAHLPDHAAQPCRLRRLCRIFSAHTLRQQDRSHGECRQCQHSGARPPTYQTSAILCAIHGFSPSKMLRTRPAIF